MKKLFTSFIFSLAFILLGNAGLSGQTVAVQPPGDGTAADPWDISTLAHLRWISENDTIGADTIIISADIDAAETRTWNDGAGYKPIDLENTDFIGVIDGQGHVIRNLYINRPTTDYIGFVSRIRDVDGIVMNLGIENCNYVGEDRVGGIAGDIDGVIENCYATGNILSVSYPGGIAGYLNGNGTILRCYAQVDITVLDRRSGGLCSENGLDSVAFSYSTGLISGSTEDVGGFMGRAADETAPSRTNDNYWDTERSGFSESSPDAALVYATGLTTAEMKKQASFTNWDFTDVWSIVEDKTYPFFQWQQIVVQNELAIEGTNSTRLGNGYVFNNTSGDATITEYGYIYGIDSLPWWTGTDFSHGTKLSEVTGASIAGGSGADIDGAVLPKVEKGTVLYAIAYAISSDGTVAFGNMVDVAPPLLSDGSGTEEDPWQISTIEQLNAINIDPELTDDYFIMMNDIDASVTKDWNDGAGWTPIDDFAGTFDGQGFDIMNLYINYDDDYVGLFGRVDNFSAVIKNLGVIDADVTGVEYVGILVGRIEDGAVAMDCHTSGVVRAIESAGGLTGRVNGDGYVYRSYSTALAYASDQRAGGFAGANFVGGSVEAVIQDCYSTGAAYSAERAGGFIGNYLTGQIFSSYSSGMSAGEDMVGAFVGNYSADSASKIENSYFDTTLVPLMPIGYNSEDYNDHIPDYFVIEIDGLTTEEMKAQANYADWDFTDVWKIKEGVSRPYLDITEVMIIGDAPVVTNQLVEATATLHNLAGANITEAGFIFRAHDLSWSDKVADGSFAGPVAVDGTANVSVAYDDVLEAGNYYSVQAYATDENGKNYYGDASFVYIEQEVYDLTVVVNDELDAAVQGATVTIDGTSVTTDVNGEALFADVVADMRMPVKVENAGYPDLLTSVIVYSDETVTINLSMNTFSVDVTVTDTAGTVLEGVTVAILEGASATTDAAGQVSFAAVTEATDIMYELSLSGYVTVTDVFDLTENSAVTLEMEPRSLTGTVLDDDGEPVEGAVVTITGLGEEESDADGVFQFIGYEPAADATMEIVADSFNIYTDSGELPNESVDFEVELEPTMVRFIITDEMGDPMYGAEVVLELDTLETEDWGFVDFERVPSGVDVAYSADKFGYAEMTGSVNLANANDTVELQMSRNLFNFTFTVTSGGEALEGAEVLLEGVDTLTTDADGMVLFENLPIGDHPYTVSSGLQYEAVSGTLSVVDADGNVDVSLTALTYDVTITVADGDGNGLEGALVTLSGYGLATSGDDGTAVFADVVPAENMVYSITLSGYEDLIDVLTVTDADLTVTAELTAIPYDVTLAVVDGDGAAVEGATVSIAGMSDMTSDASGNVALTGLTGTVAYTVTKEGYDDATGEITYADKDQTVSVTLVNAAYDVNLAIADGDGAAVEGATVSIAGMSDMTSDASGNVALTGLTGTVAFTVTKDGYDDATGELTYADKDQTVAVTLIKTVGFDEASFSAFDIYPNPAIDNVTIELNTDVSRLAIFDITGKAVMNMVVTSNQVSLNASSMKSGLYFVKVYDAREELIGVDKMIIQK